MPNTTTATWTVFSSGKKARSSEVNGNLDYSEHSLWPHSTGTKVTNTYYLGDTDAAWKGVYTYSLDPLGSTGVAIGTTTVANASSTSLELAGAKALLVNRVTTTQKNALTAVNGMFVYDTSLNFFQLYENGAWISMGNPINSIQRGNDTMNVFGGSAGDNTQSSINITVTSVTAAKAFVTNLGFDYLSGAQPPLGYSHLRLELTSSTNIKATISRQSGTLYSLTADISWELIEYS